MHKMLLFGSVLTSVQSRECQIEYIIVSEALILYSRDLFASKSIW